MSKVALCGLRVEGRDPSPSLGMEIAGRQITVQLEAEFSNDQMYLTTEGTTL